MVAGTVWAYALALVASGCSGPQPLSAAIRTQHQEAFDLALQKYTGTPREAFFRQTAVARGLTAEQVAEADARLSGTRNPFIARRDRSAVSRGAVIYQSQCVRCHGRDARGGGPDMPATLPRMDMHRAGMRFAVALHGGAPRAWFRKINEGYTSKIVNTDGSTNVMPAFKDVLAREQIWLAITYLQSLDIYAEPSGHQDAR